MCVLGCGSVAVQSGYVSGVFVGTPLGPIELVGWAEPTRSGRLAMAKGRLEDVPTVSTITKILCNLPNWQPTGVMIASEQIFRDERAERREVPSAVRRLNISALELRVVDIERPDRLRELLRNVRASEETPGYVFIIMAAGGLNRLYPFRVELEQ